jgi:hypothetical protein
MAKGGKGYSGKSSSFSISSSSYRVAPSPTPKVHNNIFSTKKSEVSKPPPQIPLKSTLSSSLPTTSSITPSSGGFLSNMADGFSFGVGSSIARNVVDRIFSTGGSRESSLSSDRVSVTSSVTPLPDSTISKECKELEKSWSECMNLHNQDMNICRKAFEDYEACKRNV